MNIGETKKVMLCGVEYRVHRISETQLRFYNKDNSFFITKKNSPLWMYIGSSGVIPISHITKAHKYCTKKISPENE